MCETATWIFSMSFMIGPTTFGSFSTDGSLPCTEVAISSLVASAAAWPPSFNIFVQRARVG